MKTFRIVPLLSIPLLLLSCSGDATKPTPENAIQEAKQLDSITMDLEASQKAIKVKSDELDALLQAID